MKKIFIKDRPELDRQIEKVQEFYKGHSKDFTRRQFIFNAGLSGATAYVNLTNIPKLFIPQSAQAAEVANNLSYVSIECAGGINFAGNIIIGRDHSGTQLAYGPEDNYMVHGLPPSMHPSKPGMIDNTYGLQFHTTSGILKGMNQVLAGKTVNINGQEIPISEMIDGICMLCRSTDDYGANPFNSSIPAVQAGAKGYLVDLVGTRGSSTGGASVCDPAVYNPKYRPPTVRSESQVKNLLSFGGAGKIRSRDFRNRSNQAQTKFMQRLSRVATERLKAFSQKKMTKEVKNNFLSAINQAGNLFKSLTPQALTPSIVAASDLNLVFPDIESTNAFEANLASDKDLIGTLGFLLFNPTPVEQGGITVNKKLAGAATLVVSGCDYHNGTAASGVAKDLEIGRYIGELIYYAALKEQSVVIDMYSDGSAGGTASGTTDTSTLGQGRVILRSDSPLGSGSMMLVYNHGKRRTLHPIVKQKNGASLRQIGRFIDSKTGGTDLRANGLAGETKNLWKIKMLNYLALMENTSDPVAIIKKFEKIYRRGLLPQDAAEMIRFKYLGS